VDVWAKIKIWSWPAAVGAAHRLGSSTGAPYSGQQGPEKGENMYQMCKGAGPCNTTVHGRVGEARYTSLTLKALTPYL
jgi:hypothetical protein